jgi:hypothetical protein
VQDYTGLAGGLAAGWVVWGLMAACYLPGYLRQPEVIETEIPDPAEVTS